MKPKRMSVEYRLNSHISRARLVCAHPNSEPDIKHTMLAPKFLRELEKDSEIKNVLWARSLGEAIRNYLKYESNGDNDEDGISQAQVDLWPEHLRGMVADCNRARVYLPSRLEWVPVTPATSKAEIQEAGEYLLRKGRESIRVGNRLLQLAKAM